MPFWETSLTMTDPALWPSPNLISTWVLEMRSPMIWRSALWERPMVTVRPWGISTYFLESVVRRKATMLVVGPGSAIRAGGWENKENPTLALEP